MPILRSTPAVLAGACLAVLATACGGRAESEPDVGSEQTDTAALVNVLTPAEAAAGWRLLFDGRTTAGWRGYRSTAMPAGWDVVDGALTRVAAAGDIVTSDEFGDFELSLEWKVAEAGNSGVMFRTTEDAAYTYESGPEMQVLDDAHHPDGQVPETSAGANYGLHSPARAVSRPAGEWNQARILAVGAHVEYWLNGEKVVEYEIGSPDWEARVRASKFGEMPGYGRARTGHIALQDHGDWVAFRNIRIRPIPDGR
jgi:hypothetical protein